MNNLRKSVAAVGALTLLALATACAGGAHRDVCAEATKAFTEYSAKLSGAASDPNEMNKITADFAAELAKLSGRADGELKSALSKMSESFGTFTIDAANPAAVTKAIEISNKINEGTRELISTCS